MASKVTEERRVVRRLERFLLEYDLKLLHEAIEIENGIKEMRNIVEEYEELHINLRQELGNDTYKDSYPEYNEKIQCIADWIREAKAVIREESVEEKKALLRAEEKYFVERIKAQLGMISDDTKCVESLETDIKVAYQLLDGYTNIFVRIEALDKEFVEEFGDNFKEYCELLDLFINKSKKFIMNLKNCEKQDEENLRSEKEKELEKQKKCEKIKISEVMYDNISERFSKLEISCQTDVSTLTDPEILSEKSKLNKIEYDFNEILDRVVKLSEMNPDEYSETDKFLTTISIRKTKLKTLLISYRNDLENEARVRDLSEEKIRNASTLGIKLSKFSGYDSKIDFYSFKSEFEKLIVPRVQAKLLSDYLKNNYLEGQALEIVREIEDIDQIWIRLKFSFGDVTTLLANKLKEVENDVPLWQIKGDEKLIKMITKVKNCMIELTNLASKHKVEGSLFHHSNTVKIFKIIGKRRQNEVMTKIIEENYDEKNVWDEIIKCLEKEIKIKEKILLYEETKVKSPEHSKIQGNLKGTKDSAYKAEHHENKKCLICEKSDHVPTVTKKGNLVINYFACEKFVNMSPRERLQALKRKNFCFQCLTPGLKANHGGICFDKFRCPNDSHKRYKSGLHVLICDQHKGNKENLDLLELYKAERITSSANAGNPFPDFCKNIGISFHVGAQKGTCEVLGEIEGCGESELAIFMLQTIRVGDQDVNLFFDSGCGDSVCKKKTVDLLMKQNRAKHIVSGPLVLSGVGKQKSICKYGKYQVTLPLHNGKNVNLSSICLDSITRVFPKYPLKEIESDIKNAYVKTGGSIKSLPRLPSYVGGDTDLMIGVQYLKYYPRKVFELPNGLSIYESQFTSTDGSRGVVAGPHRIFSEIHMNLGNNYATTSAYFHEMTKKYKSGYQHSIHSSLLGFLPDRSEIIFNDSVTPIYQNGESEEKMVNDPNARNEVFSAKRIPKNYKKFMEIESVGTEISYRCVKCRGCSDCKKNRDIECISLQEEVEQALIDKSVKVSLDKNCTTASLPFLSDPTTRLVSNETIARKIYESQVKILNKCIKDKQDIIKAEKKLHDLGFVDYVENLTADQQEAIFSSKLLYILPWRAVWNTNSISTPCRPVFDGSHPTKTGLSLNDLLAKGKNTMNKLLEVVIRWLIRRCAYHTDLQNMYNRVLLEEEHWCYQLYYFHNELDPNLEPKLKVIKTLIYGIKSSGNQAEKGLRETANLQKEQYPRQYEVVSTEVYVDDCLSGEESYEEARDVTDKLEIVLNGGGFRLKGITFSGFDPPDNLSNEDKSINVAGLKWYSKTDSLRLNLGALNFSKRQRGKKNENLNSYLPKTFTRRDCASRAAEVFDLLGRFTPITAGIKLDLRELSLRGLDWSDTVPTELIPQWIRNFEMIKGLGEIKFRRAIIPDDAINLDMETIEISDASLDLACSVVYARFKRRTGSYSCQIVFARSKVVPQGMSVPRSELFAAVLNASTGHVVNLALGKFIKNRISLSDSQIVLFWISNLKLQLKQWVRSRIAEIRRLTKPENWYYLDSKNNIADLGTKRHNKLSDVLDDSVWVNGHEWAKGDVSDFPIMSFDKLKPSKEDIKTTNCEIIKSDIMDIDWINQQLSVSYNQCYAFSKDELDNIGKRYLFSSYVIDPNKYRFKKVVRILALVISFIMNLKKRIKRPTQTTLIEHELPAHFKIRNDMYLVTQGLGTFPFVCKKGLVIELSEQQINNALFYFYRKATLEVKHFLDDNVYKNIAKEKNGILYYTGRILPSQIIDNKIELSDVCLDLTIGSFCVPIIDTFSPLAFSIINEIHWYDYDACHSGNETVLRFVQRIAHIVKGRSLVKQFRKECPRCKYIRKQCIDVAMGPISPDQVCIAPAFYYTQVDLFGPYNSYSNVNKRASIKIWFVIFCCCVTGAVDIKVCEDYSTSSFVLAFIRFACKVGYPKKLLPDAGSQLLKGCETMKIRFTDVHNKLHEYGVIYEVCPVGAHYMHGKVERKIRHVKESFAKQLQNNRLSIIQWETLGDQIANSINNLPIALGSTTSDLEKIDLITPNRLILARNNDRCPVGTVSVSENAKKIIQVNNNVFEVWFRAWLISYVPTLMIQPKWFRSDRDPKVGDIILFLRSDKEFDKQYQFGKISGVKVGRDGKIRKLDIEYQNFTEKTKRTTNRGTREIVVIHPVDELGLIRELNLLSAKLPSN